jgi:hypothetical protein
MTLVLTLFAMLVLRGPLCLFSAPGVRGEALGTAPPVAPIVPLFALLLLLLGEVRAGLPVVVVTGCPTAE